MTIPPAVATGHSYAVYAVRFSSSGLLGSASLDGTVVLWDPATGDTFCATVFFLSSSPAPVADLYPHVAGAQLSSHRHPASVGFRSLSLSSDGGLVAAGGDDDSAHVWSVADGRVRRLAEHDNTVFAVDISPGDRYVVTCCNKGED